MYFPSFFIFLSNTKIGLIMLKMKLANLYPKIRAKMKQLF
jgi:hypothetical protein